MYMGGGRRMGVLESGTKLDRSIAVGERSSGCVGALCGSLVSQLLRWATRMAVFVGVELVTAPAVYAFRGVGGPVHRSARSWGARARGRLAVIQRPRTGMGQKE